MSNILYLECYSGISGDMTVAALIDLGADQMALEKALKSLPVSGFETKISRVKKAGLDVCDFDVLLDTHHENHDHDMEYLHGGEHVQSDECHEHNCGHEYSHEHEHHHDHDHRGLPDIMLIIDQADLTEGAKRIAKKIFTILAESESKAHGVELSQVHFHEVGAVDSIVDIVAVAVCLDNLQITDVIVPMLCEGQGFIRCQHGTIPVPVPAVANIAAAHGLSLEITSTKGELVTPTGAAIVAAVKTRNQLPEHFSIQKIGIGGGKRTYDRPSMLRAMLIEEKKQEQTNVQKDTIWKLETNMDDCTGEALGFLMERLFEAGARDVTYTPVFMKKNRPGYELHVICTAEKVQELEAIIFGNTTTIGIRKVEMERSILSREVKEVLTSLGLVKYKVCKGQGVERSYPEYESVAAICREKNMDFQDVYHCLTAEGIK